VISRTSSARTLLAFLLLPLGACLPPCSSKPSASEERALSEAPVPAPEPTVTLRFRPRDRLGYREHWGYDVEGPGTGILRNALSLDVLLLAKLDRDSFAVRKTVRRQELMQDGELAEGPTLAGTSFVYHYGRDHSLASEIRVEAKNPILTLLGKSVAEAARFGTLVEYPDQAIATGDSWSIEPRTLTIVPGVQATLRPSYTLASWSRRGADTFAVIESDIQVDLVPLPVTEGVIVEGGGTASGELRVRVRDGALMDARTVMHFSQEISAPAGETLGYREFSATARVFTTEGDEDPELAAEPYKLERSEDDRECALLLSSAAQRFSSAPVHQRNYLISALHAVTLPSVRGGQELRDPGTTLAIYADARRVELDGTLIDPKDLPRALRAASRERSVVYVYADATLSLERLQAFLLLLAPRAEKRLMVRDAEAALPPAKAMPFQEERLRFALAAPDRRTRESRLHELLRAHLMLCEPALLAFQEATAGAPDTREPALRDLRGELVTAFVKCGCTATNLDGLETTLYAIFGSPDLRYVPLPENLDSLAMPGTTTITELAKALRAQAGDKRKR
jgi:hypothetical protein